MIPKQLTVLIDGRVAIPVRAIPHITGWALSPDVVAKALAREDHCGRLKNIFSYQYRSGAPLRVLPKEWDAIKIQVDAFTKYSETEALWRKNSPQILPAGVFVWLDEFESNYRIDVQRMGRVDERDGDREITLSPMACGEDDCRKVFEGFDLAMQQEASPLPGMHSETEQPRAVPMTPAPRAPASEPVTPTAMPTLPPADDVPRLEGWPLKKPQRADTLANLLYYVLKDERDSGKPLPRTLDAMKLCAEKNTFQVTELMGNEMKYLDGDGNPKTADIANVRKRIERMTSA